MDLNDKGYWDIIQTLIPDNYPIWTPIFYNLQSPILRINYSDTFKSNQIPYHSIIRLKLNGTGVMNNWVYLYPKVESEILRIPDAEYFLNLGVAISLEISNRIAFSRYSNIEVSMYSVQLENFIFDSL